MSERPPQTSTRPPSHDVKVFLSAVTDEFEPKDKANGVAYRSRLRQICARPNVTVQVQEDFMAGGVPTLDKLDDYIQSCHVVVHLVGDMTGSTAKSVAVESLKRRYPDLADRLPALRESLQSGTCDWSYTQWEAYLAVLHGKVLVIARAESSAPRGATLADDDPQRQAQRDHLERLRTLGRNTDFTFDDVKDLAAKFALSTLLDQLALAHAQPKAKPNNIPFLPLGDLFVGREGFLKDVENRLQRGRHVSAIVGAQAMHGLGGLGKTCAAVEYGLRHEHEYSALLFVAADQPETLHKSLSELCGPLVLNLPEQDVKDQTVRYAAVVNWLRRNPGWFLILDNVDDGRAAAAVEGLLSQIQTGHVLITARFGEWSGGVERLDLLVLTPEASIKFLRDRTARSRRLEPNEEMAVAELANELGGLPLALEQAAAFIVAKQESFAGYLQRWQAHEQKVRTWFDPVRMRYPCSVAVTWNTSFAELDAFSRALLNMLCWFAHEPIPVAVWKTPTAEQAIASGAERLAATVAESFHDSDSSPSGTTATPPTNDVSNLGRGTTELHDAEEARAGLSRYGLILWEPDRSAFRVHRLVQEVTRERLNAAESTASLLDALQVIDDYIPSDPPSHDVRSWPLWMPVRVHVTALVNNGDEHGITKQICRLINDLGTLLREKCVWDEAELLMRRARFIFEQSYGADHPNVATNLHNLARLLRDKNLLVEAEPLVRRALAIFERSLGAEHPYVADCLINLAGLLHDSNRLAEAESLSRRALEIYEQSQSAYHPNVANGLSELAKLLLDTSRLAEAEPLMRRALAIYEQTYGVDHPYVATGLNNLAQLLQDTNRLAEAEPLMRRALVIDEHCYGVEHPNVALRLNNLGWFLKELNRLAEAEPLMRRALVIYEQIYGVDHPTVATSLNNLAQLLQATNRLTEAEPLMRRALAIDEHSHGAHHPTVAIGLNNLARLLQDTSRPKEGEPLMHRAVEIFEQSYGADHPNVATVLNNLAQLLQATNRLAEAEPLMRRHVEIFETFHQTNGHEHPSMHSAIKNYCELLMQMQRSRREIIECFASLGITRNRIAAVLPPLNNQGRNERCACGSGKKFKSCCGQ